MSDLVTSLGRELLPSSENLQQFCHSRLGQKLRTVIDQIDVVAHLLLQMYDASFVGIFYRNSQHGVLLPVAYESWDDGDVSAIDRLEKQWLVNLDKLGVISNEEIRLDEAGYGPDGVHDEFAEENSFTRLLRYPVFDVGSLQGVVLIYWRDSARVNAVQPAYLMKALMQILLAAISIMEQVQKLDGFLSRLSVLTRIFETPLEGLKLSETVNRVLETARVLFPGYSVSLARPVPEPDSEQPIQITGLEESVPAESRDRLQAAAARLLHGIQSAAVPTRNWHHLQLPGTEIGGVLAVDIKIKADSYYLVLFHSRQSTGFGDVDLELVSVFRLFANIVLSSTTLVRELTKSNVLIRESTDRVADLESLAALADMTSGIAHRLNNIIGGVTGRLQLMQVKASTDEQRDKLHLVEEMMMEGARAVKRIQEFASCSRTSFMEQLSLTALLNKYRDHRNHDWDSLAEQKSIAVEFALDDDPAMMEGNSVDILVMVNRLLENAVEHAPEGSRVQLVLEISADHYELRVSDGGPGIPDDIRKRIFLPFFSTKPERDAGMGLAIVHSIAVRHGGAVSVDTQPEVGTTFTIRIERTSVDEDTSKILFRSEQSQQLRVLAVDDDPQILGVLCDMLGLDGHEVTTAPDGPAAVELLKNHIFDIMITDLGMPGMSGLDLAGIAHDAHPRMAIAMVTGWGTQLKSEEMAIRGIQTVLAKPFHLKDIRALVRELSETAPVS